MRSHRVGAAHRAAIRRLAALEQQNRDLLERARRQDDRLAEPAAERERDLRARGALRGGVFQRERSLAGGADAARRAPASAAAAETLSSAVVLHTQRREAAERQAASLPLDAACLGQERHRLLDHAAELGRELAAAETRLRAQTDAQRCRRRPPRRWSHAWRAD